LEGEVAGIMSLVKGLMEEVAPTDAYLQQCSGFYKHCVKLMENFCRFEGKGKLNGLQKFSVKQALVGRKALTCKFEAFDADIKAGRHKTLKDVKDFRVFHWMLSDSQKLTASGWVTLLLKLQMGKLKETKDGEKVSEGGVGVSAKKGKVVAASSASSLSSSSISASGATSSTTLMPQASVGICTSKVPQVSPEIWKLFAGKI
jgi:hypothetical protein